MTTQNTILTTFGSDDYWAQLQKSIKSNEIIVYQSQQLISRLDLNSEIPTCLTFHSIQQVKKVKGKKSTKLSKLLGVGLDSGDIIFFSVESASITFQLKNGHTNKVTDITIIGNTLYSCSLDGFVVEWDLNTNSQKSKFKAHSKSVKKIAKSYNEKFLLTADFDIKLWDVEKKTCLKTFNGHATDVTQLLFTVDDKLCISCADQDRYLSIWDVDVNGASTNVAALRLDVPPLKIATSIKGHVLALTETGELQLFNEPNITVNIPTPKKKKNKSIQTVKPQSAVGVVNLIDGEKKMEILDANFTAEKIEIVWGKTLKPNFEYLDYVNSSGNIIEKIELDRHSTALFADENSFESMSKIQDYSEKEVVITNSFDKLTHQTAKQKDSTLQEKLESMTLHTKSSENQIPTATSLNSILSQAIHSNDKLLLEKCLGVRDTKVIFTTVARLSPHQAVPLLELVLNRLQNKPSRAKTLVEWVRAVFLAHASYLMSNTALVDRLSVLYSTLDARIVTHQKLCKLSGRLDLIASGIERRTKTATETFEDEGALIYNESEEEPSDDELMEEVIGDADDLDDYDMIGNKEDLSDEELSEEEEEDQFSDNDVDGEIEDKEEDFDDIESDEDL
ncbi:WD repeat-containing protein 43 [Clydaea vesicula]|uniref:WD repeat-containing protein 43 n=1 Tax=Clydaea vesicula TaxID=447962 RepID=A0AAD5U4F1_9FUNG|nr:WD repeat-containing protein 43 [Clydaea vesicula]